MKLWAGKLHQALDERANDFNASIHFDQRMWQEDIEGSMAHATMLYEVGILSQADKEAIMGGLEAIREDIASGAYEIDLTAEDIHTAIEGELTRRIGDAGKRLHTARSRNDQVALDLRLLVLRENKDLQEALVGLCQALMAKAENHLDSLMPGYTHLQVAQPVTFAHHLMAYVQMFLRDLDRLKDAYKRANVSPLGSGALATTTHPIDRERVAELLGMGGIMENSMDGVSDRDFVIEFEGDLALVQMHLSRLSEELILWSTQAYRFVTIADAYSTGSSIMPQKKNPDMAELIRGKTGRVYGSLVQMLTTMKGTPLAYNKDMQEDKQGLFDAIDTVKDSVLIMTGMIETLTAHPKAMRQAAARGFINATDVADYLAKKGVPFRDAYRITGDLVALCIEEDTVLDDLPLETYQAACPAFEADIYQAIDLDVALQGRNLPGGPAPEAVKKQIESAKAKLKA